eukprot:jgi/Picsp_1/586/NSC_00583-R1_blue-light photoreceptor phr2-like
MNIGIVTDTVHGSVHRGTGNESHMVSQVNRAWLKGSRFTIVPTNMKLAMPGCSGLGYGWLLQNKPVSVHVGVMERMRRTVRLSGCRTRQILKSRQLIPWSYGASGECKRNVDGQSTLAGCNTVVTPSREGDKRKEPSGGIAGRKTGIVWFRGDLRLHDHEALQRAHAECSSLVPVYCFDPREFGVSPQGYDKTGPFRASFLIDAVTDLRERLRQAGSELIVRIGHPEEIVPEIGRKIGADAVYCHTEVTYEETRVEKRTKDAFVSQCGGAFKSFWTNTLHHVEDLPFSLADLPQSFDEFKKKMQAVAARGCLESEGDCLKGTPLGMYAAVGAGDIPTLKDLGLKEVEYDKNGGMGSHKDSRCIGGETEALRQLKSFVASFNRGIAESKDSDKSWSCNGTRSFSGSIAPWLASGCLSPRKMLESVMNIQEGESMNWIRFELLWRDFFRMLTKRYTDIVLPKAREVLKMKDPEFAV